MTMAKEIDIYDFGSEYAQTYTETCKCGQVLAVSTKKDWGGAEYATDVYVKCTCGKSVHFELPVN